ncbi:phosphoadenosine phosphosulfate reductase family protein [Bacteroides sp.]|uniref:phosphoadenosine phosphosulfate reductase family protein n=1 Tax=Bacteroides sp. TaxID=29523 RepID=UPI0025C1E240|nr:phosphoadenosine phosphosulfate reductase family protein [Bacteroides sp.]
MKYDLHSYDKYIVSFSGGKDSTATFLYLLENGIPIHKIELWHQDIDGDGDTFFDWEVTPDYCRKFAEAFGVKIYFQWKEGGFKGEMLRENSRTAPTHFQMEDGTIGKAGGTKGELNTRLMFPQQSADLSVRWCSSYLKIGVCSIAIVNQARFRGIRTLVLSGERGEESPQRAKYAIWEKDRADRRNGIKYQRYVDRHRPIRDWTEEEVWAIIQKYRIRVHPCYYMGWGRCSCKFCIFGNKHQFASVAHISPAQFQRVADYEKRFGKTINRKCDLWQLIKTGKIYPHITEKLKSLATGYNYNQPVIIPESEQWILPAGAFSDSCGPT